ncbi:MAG: sulfate ABC transporter permease subunit CysT [Methylococcaceae bacterium]|jgi:sulfate transport system permease protein|nr:sulfate ABC transporter permease subunit CysT [Methylococcaceae bacterium]MDZ4156037.1 sulfate ABC transporter permease subunit CysT [Methylococcales bacterium]MDP2395144.1 sulfate ABC transporter permease subunit CysT [Methylococcaceae bacterium]MDP3018714.1 sulfate ABC transporter permease subunit CysT [Methylococcaceae bacterium]MDP3388908.1 sulfate ABC transporter permease subunit CysT [Methylococcaceae bacterium]
MRQSNIMPGFGQTLGFTLFYLALIVLIPLSTLIFMSFKLSLPAYLDIITNTRVLAAFRVSFGAALVAAAIASFFGFIIAWVLVRYPFSGKKLVDAFIDLPFALPTAVAGIVMATIFQPSGFLGKLLIDSFGVQVAYRPLGIVVALIFISIPFVVRTVEPVLKEFDSAMEEAASSLGATRLQVFNKIILPNIFPSVLTGFALAFARGVGEYGSVIFIAGNQPYVSEIVPLLIITKLEQYEYEAATAIALTMLLVSFLLLLVINLLNRWMRQRSGQL